MRSNLLGDANALNPEIYPHYNSKARYIVVLFLHIYIYIYINIYKDNIQSITAISVKRAIRFGFISIHHQTKVLKQINKTSGPEDGFK